VWLYLGDGMNVDVVLVDGGERTVELVEVKKNLVKRSIEQLGFVKDTNSLVVLSGQPFLKLYIRPITHRVS
jgi:Vam6/Vps39-like protein vacuolar protein sorting-associated protein 39